MSAYSLKVLEFDNLLSLVGSYVGSPLGKAQLLSLVPLPDEAALTARQQLTAEAKEYLRSGVESAARAGPAAGGARGERQTQEPPPRSGRPRQLPGESARHRLPGNFSAFSDPAPILSKASPEGTTLDIPEIAELLAFAERASEIRSALQAVGSRFPHLAEVSARIGDFHSLLRELRGKILPSGELDDRASPELQRIRREAEKQRTAILSSLRTFLRAQPEETPRQEEIITIRGERFVVPIRVQRRSRAKGVVHGSSSSGQTVYMEPLETIDLNNELVRWREKEQREVHRILREMTARLRQRAPELAATAASIGVLDLAFACGRFALDYDCVLPRISPRSGHARLVLKEARHPLLEALFRTRGASVIPLSLVLEGEDRVLVISGPNTGGKTVALKTLGLLALMALAGLPVPAAEAEFPLFGQVLADIGDYQSLQESLSTFSSHLLNISSMISSAGRESLILLDELGSATDPEEAGALGVAVVDRFRAAGAFTVASTHHMSLKAYATNTAGVRSASMSFEERTLEPTYRLEMGWPGKSSGLAMAQRLGLPREVLDHARRALSTAHREAEQFLSRLRAEAAASIQLRAELQEKQAELAQKEKEWMEGVSRREAERATEWEQKLEALGRSFEERAEQKLREISSRATGRARAADPRNEAGRMASRIRQQAKEELRQAAGGQGDSFANQPGAARQARVGDSVRVKSLGRSGIVRSRTGDWLEVEMGRLRTRVSAEDIAEVIPASPTEKVPETAAVNIRMEEANGGSLTEIKVIGETAEEARRRVDKFLDNAFLAQVSRVRVVHGSGRGVLRKALGEMFAEHPHVEKFFPAPQNEGGAGATIVELKV